MTEEMRKREQRSQQESSCSERAPPPMTSAPILASDSMGGWGVGPLSGPLLGPPARTGRVPSSLPPPPVAHRFLCASRPLPPPARSAAPLDLLKAQPLTDSIVSSSSSSSSKSGVLIPLSYNTNTIDFLQPHTLRDNDLESRFYFRRSLGPVLRPARSKISI